MIVVTGGAGFIGSNLVAALNARGHDDIIVVDDLVDGDKFRNLADCRIADYIDRQRFLELVESGRAPDNVSHVLHQGACSDTMERDGRYMLDNNYRYSRVLLEHCQQQRIPFVYASSASVYGDGACFREEPGCEQALNVYAWSKLLFDQHVRRLSGRLEAPVHGLRYFNVYGPREAHKGRMASVAWHFYNQFVESGEVRLFRGSGGYGDGEQRRDFVAVDDVVRVNLFCMDQGHCGIVNVGTGRAGSFNEVARTVINGVRRQRNEGPLSLEEAVAGGAIRYIDFPEALRGRYQSYTEADLGALRAAGYQEEFSDVAQGVGRYVEWLGRPGGADPGTP